MKSKLIKQLACCLFLLFVTGGITGEAQSKPGIFYAVTGNGSKDTSWLFGTYHLINDSYLNEIPAVLAAFGKAKNTVVEVVIDSYELKNKGFNVTVLNLQ